MPWYNEILDSDLEDELALRKITNGKFLDLGTGPATQAVWLTKRGFNVIGSDLSETAIKRANSVMPMRKHWFRSRWYSKFQTQSQWVWLYLWPRLFHVLLPVDRQGYITKIKQILRNNGILFLKCFSDKEPRQEGPYKFSQDEIMDLFNKHFEMVGIKETVYQGTLDPYPKALFVVMKFKK